MDFNNYKSWQIPRASLSSGSNSGQSSTESIRNFDRRQSDVTGNHRKSRQTFKEDPRSFPSSTSSSASSILAKTRNKFEREKLPKNLEKLHRGSRSSQCSSSDGISSLHVSLKRFINDATAD